MKFACVIHSMNATDVVFADMVSNRKIMKWDPNNAFRDALKFKVIYGLNFYMVSNTQSVTERVYASYPH